MAPAARRWVALLALALIATFFWSSVVLAPIRILVVVFHEGGHALAALLTGGEVEAITVSLDEGGRAMTRGGFRFLILNGGYLGSLLAGVALLALCRKPGRGRVIMGLLGLGLMVAALLWFRPVFSFGFLYAGLVGFALVLGSAYAPPWLADGFTRFLGVFSVLYALVDIQSDVFRYGLFGGSWYGDGPIVTDAHMLADLTLIPAPVWGFGWLAAGVATLWLTRRWVV